MFRRVAFALALLVVGRNGAAAVTFSAPFEKTLVAGLATLQQDLQALPELQPAVVGVPLEVASWAALSPSGIVDKLALLSTQKADAVQYLMMDAPESRAQVDKFMADSTELILAFADAIESGEYATSTEPVVVQGGAATPASATTAPASAGGPAAPVSAPASTPASVGGSTAGAPLKSGSTAASASTPASAGASTVRGGAAVTAPASVQGTVGTKSVSGSTAVAGVATGISASSKTSGASTSVSAVEPASAASTSEATNSTGVSAVSLSVMVDGNSTGSSFHDGATAMEGDGSVNANSTKSTPALTPTAGSVSLTVSTVTATVVLAACAFAV